MIDSYVRANFHQRLLCVVAAAGSAVATLCASLPAGAANPPGHVAPNRVIVGPNTAFRFAGRISPDTVPFFRDYHDFSGTGSDGNAPVSELIADSKGNLYGTTEMGGSYQNGTLYRITLPTSMSGNASYKTLHSFKPGEGAAPEGAVLIGSDGAFYGTTNAGGMFGDGTVYRIDSTSFTLKTLHSFREKASAGDGYNPSGGLTVGPGGLLYGTTGFGGAYGYGTVFAISPKGASVSYSTIHSFGAPGDGAEPYQGRLVSSGSYLYGMTESGGTSNGFGVVYEMVLSGSTWNETVLHQFGTVTGDAYGPTNGLAIDTSGNLYGCGQGGHYAKGAVFELTPSAGSSGYRIIESFGAHSGEPSVASCALVLDSTGRLIGTSSGGGTYGEGTVFRLTGSGGAWTLSTRFSFGPVNNSNPYAPDAPLLGLANGYYAGTAVSGGAFGYGAMFEIKP